MCPTIKVAWDWTGLPALGIGGVTAHRETNGQPQDRCLHPWKPCPSSDTPNPPSSFPLSLPASSHSGPLLSTLVTGNCWRKVLSQTDCLTAILFSGPLRSLQQWLYILTISWCPGPLSTSSTSAAADNQLTFSRGRNSSNPSL